MKLRLFQVDAFPAARVFGGNPAAVVPLERLARRRDAAVDRRREQPLRDGVLRRGEGLLQIRWMTPTERGGPVRARDPGGRLGGLQRDRDGADAGSTSARRAGRCGGARSGTRCRSTSRPAPRSPRRRDRRPGRGPRRAPSRGPRLARLPGGLRDRGRGAGPEAGHGGSPALDHMAVIATAPGSDCDFVSRFFAAVPGHSGGPRHRLGPLHARARSGRSGSGRRGSSRARSRRAAGSCGARTGASGCRSPAAACVPRGHDRAARRVEALSSP